MVFYEEDIYYVNYTHITLIDTSQPANLTIKNSFKLNYNFSNVYNFKIDNNIGFIIGSNHSITEPWYINNGYMFLIDFDNLTESIIGEYMSNKTVRDVSIEGNFAYLMDSNYNEDANGFEIIDISNPTNLTLVNTWESDCYPTDIEVVDNYLFLTTYENGLLIFDVSNPANPQKITEYNEFPYLTNIFCDGNLLYITFEKGLIILDITNPESINLVGKKKIFFEGNGNFHKVVVENNIAYTLKASEYQGRETFVFDVSNPNKPKKLYPLGIEIGHEVKLILAFYSFWIGVPIGIITVIVVPIVVVVRKRKKKRREEMRDNVKEIQQKSTSDDKIEGKSI